MKFLQKATYWAKAGVDGYGRITFVPPEILDVRWEDRREVFLNSEGEEALSRSIVYCNKDLSDEGVLFLGESPSLNPLEEEDKAYKIKSISRIPNLLNTKMEIKVWL